MRATHPKPTAALLLALILVSWPPLWAASGDTVNDALRLFEAELPQLRAPHPGNYDTSEKIQAAWVHFQKDLALARTARKKGYAERPEMRARIEQMLGQELLLQEAETARPMHAISDAEIRDYFEAHKEQYDLPPMLGAHEIVLPYGPADPSQREKQFAKAKALVQALGTQPVPLHTFQDFAKTNSDPQYFQRNSGTLGLFPARPHAGQAPPVPQAAIDALVELKQIGRVTGVVDDGRTLRIFRLSAFREAVPPKLETFKGSIRREISLKARDSRVDELARESGWDPAARLPDEEVKRLLRPAMPAATPAAGLPPIPGGLDIPAPPSNPEKRL